MTIPEYSNRKKATKIKALYSVINPETNSDSASTRSKGVLLSSLKQVIKKIKNIGNKGIASQITSCISTIFVKLNEPTNNNPTKAAPLKASS